MPSNATLSEELNTFAIEITIPTRWRSLRFAESINPIQT
jgi:hypothetical protein